MNPRITGSFEYNDNTRMALSSEEAIDVSGAAVDAALELRADTPLGYFSVVPRLRELAGWSGLLVLIDRGTGRTRTISLWDGDESLAATQERAGEFRRSLAGALDESYTGFAEYDVLLDVAPAA